MTDEKTIEIRDDSGVVYVRKVYTRNGERLEIEVPESGHRIRLDPIELESLTWQTKEALATLREQGPRAEHGGGGQR